MYMYIYIKLAHLHCFIRQFVNAKFSAIATKEIYSIIQTKWTAKYDILRGIFVEKK